jgi:hypothetical protein
MSTSGAAVAASSPKEKLERLASCLEVSERLGLYTGRVYELEGDPLMSGINEFFERHNVFEHWNEGRLDWEEIRPALHEQQKALRQKVLVEQFRNNLAHRFVQDWCKDVASIGKYESDIVERTLRHELLPRDGNEFYKYMHDVVDHGVKIANGNLEKRIGRLSWSAWWGYGKETFIGVCRLLFTVALFSVARSSFETLAIGLLVLIYTRAIVAPSRQTFGLASAGFAMDWEFRRLRNIIGIEREDPDAREIHDKAFIEALRNRKRGEVQHYIADTFLSLIWLLAMYKIIAAILS